MIVIAIFGWKFQNFQAYEEGMRSGRNRGRHDTSGLEHIPGRYSRAVQEMPMVPPPRSASVPSGSGARGGGPRFWGGFGLAGRGGGGQGRSGVSGGVPGRGGDGQGRAEQGGGQGRSGQGGGQGRSGQGRGGPSTSKQDFGFGKR
jgi:hypothetical protein